VSQLKKLAGQTALYGLSSIVGRLLNYFLVPWYTRIFDQSQFGVVTDLYAYTVVFLILLTYGMETAFFNFSKTEKDPDSIYTTGLLSLICTSLLFGIFIYTFQETIASLLGYEENGLFVLWIAIIIALDAMLSLPFAKLRREGKALQFAVIKLLNIGSNIALNILFLLVIPHAFTVGYAMEYKPLYDSIDPIGYVFFSNLIASIFTAILLLPVCLKGHGVYSIGLHKKMLRYGLPLLFAGLAGSVNEVFDRILLKYLLVIPDFVHDSSEYVLSQIGIYGANYKLSIVMTLFIQTFRYAFEPFFFSNSDQKDSKELYARILKYFVIFGLSIFLFVMLGIDFFQFFIGESFREGLHIVPILLVANLFLGIVFNLSLWFKVTDNTKYGALIAGIGALITIVSNVVLIPFLGYTGSAWATLICYVSMACISYLLGQKHYKIDYDLKSIAVYIIFAGFVYAIVEALPSFGTAFNYGLRAIALSLFVGASVLYEWKQLKRKNYEIENCQ